MINRLISSAALAAALTFVAVPAFATSSNSQGTYSTTYAGNSYSQEHLPPVSKNASNITNADIQSDIAPPLPLPTVGVDAAPTRYLHAAWRDLSADRTGAAQQALEMAETRLLDRSVAATDANQPDGSPVIGNISNALDAISHGNMEMAQQQTSLALSDLTDRQST